MKPTHYGCEHELADIDRNKPLSPGYGWDTKDITIVNSNGIAADPKNKFYHFGGEINTPPTDTPVGQVKCLHEIKALFPNAAINYRSNLHVHVHVPGLKENLPALKQMQQYIHVNMPKVFEHIAALPRPTHGRLLRGSEPDEYLGALRRWRRRKVSHRTLLTPSRLKRQLRAKTVEEFFRLEVPSSAIGSPLWHFQPRLCVNLRHLREKEETIEFRHFPGTLEEDKLERCVLWCKEFTYWALHNEPIESLLSLYPSYVFPKFPLYNHKMERRYRATVHDGTVPPEQIRENIRLILEGKFK